jgi:hypothetical protein
MNSQQLHGMRMEMDNLLANKRGFWRHEVVGTTIAVALLSLRSSEINTGRTNCC